MSLYTGYEPDMEHFPEVVDELLSAKHQFCITRKIDGAGVIYRWPQRFVMDSRGNGVVLESIMEGWKYTNPRLRWLQDNPQFNPDTPCAVIGVIDHNAILYVHDIFDIMWGDLRDTGTVKQWVLKWRHTDKVKNIAHPEWVYHSHLPCTQSLKHPTDPQAMREWLRGLAQFEWPHTNMPGEGIVVRTVTPMRSKILKSRFSFKVLNLMWKGEKSWSAF